MIGSHKGGAKKELNSEGESYRDRENLIYIYICISISEKGVRENINIKKWRKKMGKRILRSERGRGRMRDWEKHLQRKKI